jgi:hypothetical protein
MVSAGIGEMVIHQKTMLSPGVRHRAIADRRHLPPNSTAQLACDRSRLVRVMAPVSVQMQRCHPVAGRFAVAGGHHGEDVPA